MCNIYFCVVVFSVLGILLFFVGSFVYVVMILMWLVLVNDGGVVVWGYWIKCNGLVIVNNIGNVVMMYLVMGLLENIVYVFNVVVINLVGIGFDGN